MQTCQELSEVQNGIIFGFREKVGSIFETAKFVDCSCVTVVKVYHAWQNGTVQNQWRGKCGVRRAIGDMMAAERSLLRLILRSRRLVHAPMLTAFHQQRRLEFSYRYRNWASNERRQDGGIYQQDIAECHTTDSVRAWFKEHQDQLIVLPYPENSPDLSPINNL
ncbi:DDE_3 domain-containing protein [Trichonephila clavipes]|nr:DDE_3 domain-containing protein [Trichonephila clavipes]